MIGMKDLVKNIISHQCKIQNKLLIVDTARKMKYKRFWENLQCKTDHTITHFNFKEFNKRKGKIKENAL